MPISPSAQTKPKKLLILTSSGGGGLIQAAKAKEQEAKVKDPNIVIIRRDVLRNWMGKWFGKFCCNRWNGAQINGNVDALKFLIEVQYVFDYFCWPIFFFCSLWTFFREDIDQVIDTQPMGTSAILKALRIYRRKTGKNIKLEKVVVDLPTKRATHFLRPIKYLARADRPFLQLTAIAPLLEEGQTAEDFWQKNCGLSEADIHYQDMYVRQSFLKFQNKQRTSEVFDLFIRCKAKEELAFLKKSYKKSFLTGQLKEEQLHFSIPQHARVITVLLGSQPAHEATLNYVKKFVQIARESSSSKNPICLFVFCGDYQSNQMTLLQKMSESIARIKDYPKNLAVIPFSFQEDDVIAALFHRSDLTCTRSGGQTAMELMCVSSGEIWIHSEAKKEANKNKELSFEQLLEGIPGWEAANACYLQKICNAKIVTPEIFAPLARRLLKADGSAASRNPSSLRGESRQAI